MTPRHFQGPQLLLLACHLLFGNSPAWSHAQDQCDDVAASNSGTWQRRYSEHHASVLLGHASQKYIVIGSISGLADDLSLIASMLYVAILTDRALLISEDMPYTTAYDQPNIAWSDTRCLDNVSLTSVDLTLSSAGEMPFNPFISALLNQSLEDAGGSADLWRVQGNLGLINIIFDNPLYKQLLSEMGLRPEAAFRCALNFLFAPSASVKTYFAHEFAVMSSEAFKVGIQARFGDSHLRGGTEGKYAEASLPSVEHFFLCAHHLIDTYRKPQQEAVMFLVSDSLEVRRQASNRYGPKLLTKLDEPGHTHLTQGDQQKQAMIYAAGEHWLFGMANYHIISSVGKSGALRSREWHSIYSLKVFGGNGAVCDGAKALEFSELVQIAPFV